MQYNNQEELKNINKVKTMGNLKFITKEQLLETLCISTTTYYEVTKKGHENYDPHFPKPVDVFTSKKLRFSSVDVDNYILRYSHSSAA